MTKRAMGAAGLAALILVLLAVAGAGCSRSNPEKELRREVEAFWQDQMDGNWARCWERFSPEVLEHLRRDNPEGFRDASSYATTRTLWAAQNPLVRVTLLSVRLDETKRLGRVTVGLQIRGKRHPRQVDQVWRYEPEGKRWLLSR